MKTLNRVITVLAIIGIIYHLAYVLYPLQTPKEHLNAHLTFVLIIIYLTQLQKSRKWWPVTVGLLVLSLVATGYIKIFYWQLEDRLGFPTASDVVIGIILLVVVFEASRRTMGLTLVILALFFMGYAFFGSYLPRPFYTPPMRFTEIIGALTTSLQGIHGILLEVSAYYILLFIIMGAIMQLTTATTFVNGIGQMLGRKLRGGPAMTAVIGSALVGTVSGSTAANVAVTGAFTIPLMKRVGYTPAEAGAIEAAASNCGQIMPPVMGAAAFVMFKLTGVPYFKIIVVAAIPAILYVISVAMYVQLVAVKRNINAQDVLGEPISGKNMLLSSPGFLLPLTVIVFLLFQGFSPMYVAFWAVIVCAVLALVNRSSLKAWFQAALSGATAAATVAIGTAICGVIVKAVVMTGLVTKLPGIVESLSGGRILVALVLTMIISIILGMGVPTTPAYIIVAIMAAPILVGMGVELVAAHMFVFYFAVMSMLTPPVAPAAIIASQIAGASYLKTAVECVKPAIIGFLIPFIFVANPVFLAQPSAPLWSTIAVIATLLILLSAQVALVGQYFTILSQLQRWLFLICAVVLFVSIVIIKSYLIFAVGAALFLLLTAGQMQKWLRIKRQLASATV